ncbi:hypothetical protein ADL00_02690 [Streptomyces sp. AS58]|uniref:hypothetical protein n=1 Tax=Streptomyces sp. AS58 TaxID=1519489 RepID=UPI0006B03FF8|nr:hypothetical protein [Streptomyces sp. AS58]KOV74266.1 hypothetical protein ADL00_02690 [Streptomyces sp. AS58]
MNTGVKITAFAAAVAATFAATYAIGATVDPVTSGPESAAHAEHPPPAGRRSGNADTTPAGLQSSQAGYTLDLTSPRITAAKKEQLSFAIRDQEGRQLTSYRREHGKELHLILVSRDLVTYQHLHPTRAADGTWNAPVTLPAAGSYRVFADFTPAIEGAANLILGADIAASGTYKASTLPKPAATTTVDGYTVTLNGELRPGGSTQLTLTVHRGGRPVTDLEPYLGAYGHLVALRSGDLAYLHVHPNGEPGDGTTKPGPGISFTATAPSAGTYRLFLDFQHNGTVRTAAFTVPTSKTASATESADTEKQGNHQH